jgi:hypothetical protein
MKEDNLNNHHAKQIYYTNQTHTIQLKVREKKVNGRNTYHLIKRVGVILEGTTRIRLFHTNVNLNELYQCYW